MAPAPPALLWRLRTWTATCALHARGRTARSLCTVACKRVCTKVGTIGATAGPEYCFREELSGVLSVSGVHVSLVLCDPV